MLEEMKEKQKRGNQKEMNRGAGRKCRLTKETSRLLQNAIAFKSIPRRFLGKVKNKRTEKRIKEEREQGSVKEGRGEESTSCTVNRRPAPREMDDVLRRRKVFEKGDRFTFRLVPISTSFISSRSLSSLLSFPDDLYLFCG